MRPLWPVAPGPARQRGNDGAIAGHHRLRDAGGDVSAPGERRPAVATGGGMELMEARIPPPATDQSLRRWLRLARNELREILRDRRTILTLALMPLLLYPLLGIGFHFLYGGGTHASEGAVPAYHIGFETEA